MINTSRIIRTGDPIPSVELDNAQTEELLAEMSRLYVERCKALQAGNTIALQLYASQIAKIKAQLDRI